MSGNRRVLASAAPRQLKSTSYTTAKDARGDGDEIEKNGRLRNRARHGVLSSFRTRT